MTINLDRELDGLRQAEFDNDNERLEYILERLTNAMSSVVSVALDHLYSEWPMESDIVADMPQQELESFLTSALITKLSGKLHLKYSSILMSALLRKKMGV